MKLFTNPQKWLVCGLLTCACLTAAISQWTVEQMPNQHGQFSAVSLGGRVFFGPASSFSGFHSHVDVYNAEYGAWEQTLEVSTPRCNAAGVATEGRVYFAGGLSNSWLSPVMLDVVDIYDTLSGEWTTESLSEGRSELSAVHAGGKLLFAGGISNLTGDFVSTPTIITTSSVVDIYDLATGEWSTANLSRPRVGMAAAVAGNIAVFAGGQTASGTVTDTMDIYDAATGLWSVTTLSEAKGWCSAEILNGKAFIAGGVTGDFEVTDKVEILDLETMTWESAQLSEARGGMRSAVMGERIFFAAGGKYDLTHYIWTSPFSAMVDIYDAAAQEWTTDELQNGRINHAAAVARNQFFVAGGAGSFDEVEIFTDPTFSAARERSEDIGFSIFPNPASGQLRLEVQNGNNHALTVQIFDLNGKLLKAVEMPNGNWLSMNVADMNAGIHIVKISGEQGTTTKKLVKQ
ncbi:MAG: T9SS type A sorting domain-containing protein [Lewinellaceae bacterium]|nr:T9SS type A sorting domain-containing protein [Lewinellaceae bacterium]